MTTSICWRLKLGCGSLRYASVLKCRMGNLQPRREGVSCFCEPGGVQFIIISEAVRGTLSPLVVKDPPYFLLASEETVGCIFKNHCESPALASKELCTRCQFAISLVACVEASSAPPNTSDYEEGPDVINSSKLAYFTAFTQSVCAWHSHLHVQFGHVCQYNAHCCSGMYN